MNDENALVIDFEELNKKIFRLYKEKKNFVTKLELLLKDVINNDTES